MLHVGYRNCPARLVPLRPVNFSSFPQQKWRKYLPVLPAIQIREKVAFFPSTLSLLNEKNATVGVKACGRQTHMKNGSDSWYLFTLTTDHDLPKEVRVRA